MKNDNTSKQDIIAQIVSLLSQLIADNNNSEEATTTPADAPIEMLTIKECTAAVPGLTVNTIRQLIAQGKLPHIRTGQGKNGKILIAKSALMKYIDSIS